MRCSKSIWGSTPTKWMGYMGKCSREKIGIGIGKIAAYVRFALLTTDTNMNDGLKHITVVAHWRFLSTRKKAVCEAQILNSQSAQNFLMKSFSMACPFPFPQGGLSKMRLTF